MTDVNDIVQRLETPISKVEVLVLSKRVDRLGPSVITELIKYLYPKDNLSLRVSWLLENVIIPNKEWHTAFQNDLVKALIDSGNPMIRRNVAKTISKMDVSEKHHDELYAFSIDRISDSAEAVAVKVHCVSIAFQVVKVYPDLANEFKAVLENEFSRNSVAFAANVRKVLKRLDKLIA